MSIKTDELRRTMIAIKLWEAFEASVKTEERDILTRLCQGDCLKVIAAELGMNYSAAHKRLGRWQEKLQVQTVEQLLFIWRSLMGDEIEVPVSASPVLTELAAVAAYRAASANLAERETKALNQRISALLWAKRPRALPVVRLGLV